MITAIAIVLFALTSASSDDQGTDIPEMRFTCNDQSRQKMVLASVENTQNSKRVAIRLILGKPLAIDGFDLINGLQKADMTDLPDGSRKIYFMFSGKYKNKNHIVEFFWKIDSQGHLTSRLALPLDGISSSIVCSRLPDSSTRDGQK